MSERDDDRASPESRENRSAEIPRGTEESPPLHARDLEPSARPRLTGARKGIARQEQLSRAVHGGRLSGDQRLLILDSWQRSGLSAADFAPLVGVTTHTLYTWRRAFNEYGPAALEEHQRGMRKGSRLGEPTKRAILMLKTAHPEWGCERLSDVLWRSQGHAASANAIAHFLKEKGYVAPPAPESEPHAPLVHHFERARVNQLWQTDLFTFLLTTPARPRVYLVIFMDDHSRFVVSWGLHATASGALVRETLLAGITNFGAPEEVLTDNGPQYATWRGTSAFTKLLRARGIKHVLARPRHPQTVGKAERFWGSLWRECLESAQIRSVDEARLRVGLYIDHYNFHRPHQGIDGLTPADRFFEAAPEVLKTLKARVTPRAGELARDGLPRKSFYLTGRIGDAGISVHAEGERIVLTTEDGHREEVDLGARGRRGDAAAVEDLPEVVTPAAREVQDDATERGADEEEPDAGDPSLREPDREEDGGGDPGSAGRSEDAVVGGGESRDLGRALLHPGAAGAAGPGLGAGAAGAGPSGDAGAACRGAREGEDEARARPAAQPGPGAGGAACDRDPAGDDPAEEEREEESSPLGAWPFGGSGAADGDGDER
jgi:transposase InsO family protein